MAEDTSAQAREGGAAAKQRVRLTLRIARDGKIQTFVSVGRMHRLPTGSGWAIMCKLPDSGRQQPALERDAAKTAGNPADSAIDGADGSDLSLIIRPDEIRMKRTGQLSQDQRFRTGHWLAGTISTAYGDLRAEAWTHRIEMDLTSDGGAVEWEYDLRTAELKLGRTAVTLHIQEAPSV